MNAKQPPSTLTASRNTAVPAIVLRDRMLEWRDTHSAAAMLAFNALWRDLRPTIEDRLSDLSYKSALVEPHAYIAREIDPLLAQTFGGETDRLVNEARDDLATLTRCDIALDGTIDNTDDLEDRLTAAQDVLEGLVPLAGGIAMGAALPSFAVASGTAMFGLLATSTVSLPMLAVGLTVAGTGVAVGAIKTSTLHARVTKRMMARIDRHVAAAILSIDAIGDMGGNTGGDAPPILARILAAYQDTLNEVLARNDERTVA